jgi:hypothetical protein
MTKRKERKVDEYAEFVARKLSKVPPTGLSEVPELHASLFPFQKDLAAWALRRGRAAIFASTGLGKALASDTPVLTPSGYVPISTLVPGDMVIGASGQATRVTGVFPQGVRPAFRVTMSDQSSVVCDAEHLWTVRTGNDRQRSKTWRTMTLAEIVKSGLGSKGPTRHDRWFIPMVSPVEMTDGDLPLHPYVLGCLLGDGHIVGSTPYLSSGDPELVAAFNERLPIGMAAVKRRYSKYDYAILRTDPNESGRRGGHWPNPVSEALAELGLLGTRSETKFIPDSYLFAARDTREWLLRGLMDTDGSVWMSKNTPMLEYSSVSRRMIEGVQFMVQSLGGRCSIKVKATTGQLAYRVTPNFPAGAKPFFLSRKAEKWRDREKYAPTRSIRSVAEVEPVDMTCIKVDAEDGLFVINDCIITHNTAMQLEWSRHVSEHCRATLGNDRILILSPLAVAAQTVREGERIGMQVTLCREADDVRDGVNITNYDRLHRLDAKSFSGVVLDESSLIKHHDSKTLASLIEAFSATPFRLCATATPSPNDYTELGTHAEFLGICTREEMLAEFFVHDGGETQKWRLKGHARSLFWRWVSGWGAMLRKPSDLGYEDGNYNLPPLNIEHHVMPADHSTVKASGLLFAAEASTLSERRGARRGSLVARVGACVAQVASEPSERWVVWCDLNAEQDALAAAFGDECFSIYGSLDADEKESRLIRFLNGERRILLGKPSIFGFGINIQSVARVAFVGVTDSWEAYYQAVRRCWRFGQTRPVSVHIFASELEGAVLANLKRKEADAAEMAEQLSAETRDAVRAEVRGQPRQTNDYSPKSKISIPSWLKEAT